MLEARFFLKEKNTPNNQIIYWFDVGGDHYGVSHQNGEVSVIDCDTMQVNLTDDKNVNLLDLPGIVTDEMMEA